MSVKIALNAQQVQVLIAALQKEFNAQVQHPQAFSTLEGTRASRSTTTVPCPTPASCGAAVPAVTNKQLAKRVRQLDKLTEARNALNMHAVDLGISRDELIRLLFALDIAEGVQQYVDARNKDENLQDDEKATVEGIWLACADDDTFYQADELREEIQQFCAVLDAVDAA